MTRFNLRRRLPNVNIVEEQAPEESKVESNPEFEKTFNELSVYDSQQVIHPPREMTQRTEPVNIPRPETRREREEYRPQYRPRDEQPVQPRSDRVQKIPSTMGYDHYE